ncbi:MAG: binding-protein-dependent transport system inner rane component [Nocardioidaceae bacterium]|nr:binding-protein-dependent transport system inner rane component [Nocardioidaceae bacterium]
MILALPRGGSHASTLAALPGIDTSSDCYNFVNNSWFCPAYLTDRRAELLAATQEHIWITVVSVLVGALVAYPLALLARRSPAVSAVVLGGSTILYTIPSLAMFSLMLIPPLPGISPWSVVIGLALYTLTILVRNMVAGLEAVPEEVRDAARGLGYGRLKLLLRIETPLAMPVIIAGLRVATVSTVALLTVGSILGYGGLGNLLRLGVQSDFRAQVLTASVLCVALAVAFDLILLGLQRLALPWQRG